MLTPCNFLAPNGDRSELAQHLIEEYGPERAIGIWNVLHSDDVLSNIHDWQSDTRWNTAKGELIPEVAKYVHNIYTARNEWNKLRSDDKLGNIKLRKEYYQASAEQLKNIYEGAQISTGKDLFNRTVYKVTIPNPEFSEDIATKLASGEKLEDKQYVHNLTTPGDYITPELPDKEIKPSLNRNVMLALAKGTENTFLQGTDHDMAIGDKAMVYTNGKPMIATYNGKTDDGKAHRFIVSNPYTPEQIAHEELGLSKDTETPSLESNGHLLQESLGRMFAQVRDENGQPIEGQYFTPEQQNDAISAVLTDVYGHLRNSLKNGDNLTANLLLRSLELTRAKLNAFNNGLKDVVGGVAPDTFMWSDLDPADALARSQEITNVLRSYDQIAGFTMERLRAYGFHVSDNIRENITDYLNRTQALTEDENNMDQDLGEAGKVEITGDEGKGLKDWSDSPFELDPRDTASKRMKFFLATIKDSEFGVEEAPKRVQMIFSDPEIVNKISKGTKVYTVRTPDQAKRIKPGTDGRGSVVLDGKTFTIQEHKVLDSEESLGNWKDVFDEEKLTPETGSIVYKLSEFKPRDGVLVNKKSAMGFPKLAPFDQTFTDLLAKVQDASEVSYDGFIDSLRRSGNANMMRVAQEVENSDQQLKNEFFKVFSKQYYRMRILLFNNRAEGNDTITQGSFINANRFNEIDTLINGWREQQKIAPIITHDNGKLGVDSELANYHLNQFKRISNFNWAKADSGVIAKLRDWAQEFLNDIGIAMTPEAMKDFQANAERLTKGTQFAGSWLKQFSVTADGKPNGVISALVLRLNGLATPDEQVDENRVENVDPEQDFIRNNNPLYTENTALRILAKSQAKFTPSLFTDMHKSSEGKNIYSYGLHTYESHTFNALKNNEAFRVQYASIPFSSRSWLLGRLSSASQRESIELNYLDGIKAAYRRGGGTTRADMSPREQELTAVLAFLNRGNKNASFFDLTKSDKTTTPVIVGVEKFPVKSFELTKDHSKALNNVFESEFERVKHWEDNKDSLNNRSYKAGGGLFYMLPQFNFEEMSKDLRRSKISKDEFNSIWNDDGSISRVEDTVTRNSVVNRYMDEFVKAQARATRERWKKMGLYDKDRIWLDQAYVKKAMGNLAIFRNQDKGPNGEVLYNQFKDGRVQPITKAEVHELVASLAALDYSSHYFLHNTSMAQLISGDPALAYKGQKGDPQVKQVEDTMKEYQKRLAKDIGPGSDPQWGTNTKYRSMTITDPNYNSYLGEVLPGYRDLDTAADAQEITTTQEHINVMYAQGLIPDRTYHEMSQIIEAGKGGYYEFTKPEHLDIVLQAQKPVQVGSDFRNGLMEIHYVKTSSYPLLPQLTVGKEIDQLRQHMERNDVQRAVFKSGKKLGVPEQTASVFDGDGKFVGKSSKMNAATQTLDRAGFRIQQEVPYDESKGKILTVSQMNKLIVEGIQNIPDFKMPNYDNQVEGEHERTISGAEMRELKEQTRMEMFNIERHTLLKSIGAVPTDNGYIFSGHDKMFKALEHEAISRDYPPNDLEAIRTRLSSGQLVLPLFLNGSADRFESLMMSMVKKTVALQQPGKSFIQASSLGFKGHITDTELTAEQKKGIIYIEGHNPSQNLRSMQKDGTQVKAAQVMVPFDFLSKDGRQMDISKFTKQTEDGRTIIDSDKLPDSLRRFVGARIPNQEHSSMLPIEIVGFIPKQMGDLMIVPAEITKQMGSDFDVDKLYVYRPNYSFDQSKGKLVPQRMSTEDRKGSKDHMRQLQQQYFDIHWSILTHPDMFNRVNEPLDKPELKNEKALTEARTKNQGIRNYFSPANQMDDFMSQKDAKTLVGATAVNNTFNAIIQDKDVRLGHHIITDSGELKEVLDYIHVLDEATGDKLALNRLSGFGTSKYYPGENPSPDDQHFVRTKGNNISTQLSEVVDHSKNRTIDAINLNQYTFPASAAMTLLETRDGKALNLKYNSRLIQQQIVREFSDLMSQGNDSLSDNFQSNLKDQIISNLLVKYAGLAGPDFDSSKSEVLFSPQKLQALLDTPENKRDAEYYRQQYHALELFAQFYRVGETLRGIQSKFNQDTRGAGPDLLASLNTQGQMPTTMNNGSILGVETIGGRLDEKTGLLNATTEAGHTYKNTVEVANGLYPELLPYHKIQPLYGSISTEMGRDRLSLDHQRRIADAVRSNLFSDGRNGLFENASAERARLLFDTDAGSSLARRIAEAQGSWGKGNYFITRLSTHLATKDGEESSITYNATGASSLDDFEITKAWAGLLTSKDPIQRQLGEDLLRYTYATGGIQTAQNFAKFAPIGYLAGLPIARELNDRVNTLERSVTGLEGGALEQQIFQHNPDMAMQIKPDFSQTREHQYSPADRIPEEFTLFKDITNTEHPAAKLTITALDEYGKPTMRYPDYLSTRSANGWLLYKRMSEGDGYTGYQRIDLLGKGDILEYDPSRAYARSIFPDNRALKPLWKTADAEMAHTPAAQVRSQVDYARVGDELGITEKPNSVSEVIDNIIDHDGISSGSKQVLVELFRLADKTSETIANEKLPNITLSHSDPFDLGAFSYKLTKDDNGEIHYKDPSIRLSQHALSSPERAAEVLIHELTHYNSSLVLKGYERWKKGESERPEWMTNSILDSIHAIEDIRERLTKEFPMTSYAVRYALGSNEEFISGVMQSREMQQELNSMQSDDASSKSLLSRVIEHIHDIVSAIADYLGFNVNKGSLLEDALMHSATIMGAKVEGDSVGARIRELGDSGEIGGGEHQMIGFDGLDPEVATLDPSIERARNNLNGLMKKLQAKQVLPNHRMSEEDAREYHLRGQEINRLQYEIGKLNAQATLHSLVTIGSRQMKSIDAMLAGDRKLSTRQLENLLDTADTWEHTIDELYSDVTNGKLPAEAQTLRGQAAERKARITNLVKQYELDDPNSVITKLADFNADQMKVGLFTGYTTDLSRTNSMVAQRIDTYLKNASRLHVEEMRRFRKELSEYQDKVNKFAKARGTTTQDVFDQLMQKNGWGLVTMFSPEYFEFKHRMARSLHNKLDAADAITDPTTRLAAMREAYKTYRDGINKNIVYVDTTRLFDDQTGDSLDTPEATKHRKMLEKELGPDLANTMIDKAKVAYEQYLRDRYSYKAAKTEQVRAQLDDYFTELEEKRGMTREEKSKAYEDMKAALTKSFNEDYNEWEGHNSPNVFFRSMRGEYRGFNPKFQNFDAVVDAPRREAAVSKDGKNPFYDERFAKVQQDAELRDMYEFIQTKMDQLKAMLPAHVVQELYDNFLPIVEREHKIGLNLKETGKAIGDKIKDAISMDPDAVDYSRMDTGMVPIRYVKPYNVDIKDRDRDIFRLLEKFGNMAIHYKRATEVQSSVELLHRIMVDQISETKGGQFDRINSSTKHLSDMVAFAKDRLLYQRGREAEGDIGKLYSINPVKQYKTERIVAELRDKMADLDKKYAEEGMDPEQYQKEKSALAAQIAQIPHSELVLSRMGDTMIKITELKTLSYNPFSAFANLGFGLISLMSHANGQVDFNKKTAFDAFTTTLHATKRAFSFGTLDSNTAKKILALMERYNTMGDLLDSDYAGGSRIQNKKTLGQKLASPYQLLRNSDYFMKGTILVAMMKTQHVMVDGKEMNLWDAYDTRGKFKGTDEEAKKWESQHPEDETEFLKFQARAIQVAKVIMGNQDHASPMMIKKTVIGRMVSQFKATWLPEGINSRFGDERYDSQLGRVVKGRYKTYKDLGAIGSVVTLARQAFSTLFSIDPFTQRRRDGKAMQPVDIENMRRNFAEVATYLTIMATVVALKMQLEKEDDSSPEAKRNKAFGRVLINMIVRNKQDMDFYASPDLFTNLTGSLVPSLKVWMDFKRAVSGTVKYVGQDSSTKNPVKGDAVIEKWMRSIPYTSLYPKFHTMWSKDMDQLNN